MLHGRMNPITIIINQNKIYIALRLDLFDLTFIFSRKEKVLIFSV